MPALGMGIDLALAPRVASSGGTPTPTPSVLTPSNWDFISYGDSRVSAGVQALSSQANGYSTYTSNLGWTGGLGARSGNRLRPGRFSNFGIGASTTTQGAAVPRLDAVNGASAGRFDRPDGNFAGNKSAIDAKNHAAGIVIYLYGTNDTTGIPATSLTNTETILDNIGPTKLVIICNELPRGINMTGAAANAASVPANNYSLSRSLLKYDYASGDAKARSNVIVVNTYDAWLDVASGASYNNLRGMSYDGLHEAPYGSAVICNAIVTRLAAVYGATWTALPDQTVKPTANGLVSLANSAPYVNSNPVFTPGTNGTVSGTWGTPPVNTGVAQGWTLSGTNVPSMVGVAEKGVETDPDGYPVQKFTASGNVAAATTATVSFSQTLSGASLTSAISGGFLALTDRLRGFCRMKIDAGSALLYHVRVRLVVTDSTVTRSQQAVSNQGTTVTGALINDFLDAEDGTWRDYMTELLDMQDANLVAASMNVAAISNVTIWIDIAFRNNTAGSLPAAATVRLSRAGWYRSADQTP